MIITVAALKGGVGKTTTAIHLAQYFGLQGEKVLLMDNDPSEFALAYKANGGEGGGLAFDVLPMAAATKSIHKYRHVVIDTEARPSNDDLANYAQGCHLLIVPAEPAPMSLDALVKIQQKLDGAQNWRSLLTIVPPPPSTDEADTRAVLDAAGIPLFEAPIPRAAAFVHASRKGIPVYDWKDKRSRDVWAAYERVGQEIEAIVAEEGE